MSEALKLALILRDTCEGGEEMDVDIYAIGYAPTGGDVYVIRAAQLLKEQAVRLAELEQTVKNKDWARRTLIEQPDFHKSRIAELEAQLAAAPAQPETWKVLPSPARGTGEMLHQAFPEIPGEPWPLPASRQAGSVGAICGTSECAAGGGDWWQPSAHERRNGS